MSKLLRDRHPPGQGEDSESTDGSDEEDLFETINRKILKEEMADSINQEDSQGNLSFNLII